MGRKYQSPNMSRYVQVQIHTSVAGGEQINSFRREFDLPDNTLRLFRLTDDSVWLQENVPSLISDEDTIVYDEEVDLQCRSIYNLTNGEELLRYLNEQSRNMQMENGVNECDVVCGTTIVNCMGVVIS